jgi:deoxyribonuclease-2
MNLSPLNEAGKPVDWWFMYKVPRLKAAGAIVAATGFEYAYYDSTSSEITRSPYTLDSDNGALFHTLDSLFANPSANTGWLLYNDETPEPNSTTSLTLGHSKGAIGFDVGSNTAFWLLHSWPKFPSPDGTAQPSPMYGQTFLCIALDLDNVRELTTQMHTYQEPQIYSPRIPTSMAVDDPIRLLGAGTTNKDPAGSNMIDLTSRGGNAFQVIAKNSNWNDDFWNDLVVDEIEASIDVDSWIRGGPSVIPPTADPTQTHTVADIKYITLAQVGLPWAWPETKDHAKWAISEAGQGNWVCVGDINRMISQRKRGGCTIAFKNDKLWTLLSKTDKFVVPEGVKLSKVEAEALVEKTSRDTTETFQKAKATRI